MEKKKITTDITPYPMPMAIIGAHVDDNPTFMAVAWVNRVNFKPPIMGIAVGKNHYTNIGIEKNGEFSINFPGVDLIEKTDYSGLISGKVTDKSDLFESFYGDLKAAPMVKECAVNMECRLIDTVSLASNNLFLAEIVNVFANEDILTDDLPDITKFNPFTVTLPDSNYWAVGKNLGKAWNIGKIISKEGE